LPPGSRQHEAISARVSSLSERSIPARYRVGKIPFQPIPCRCRKKTRLGKIWAWTVAVVGLALTKGKLLLIGVDQGRTLWSMLLSFGVYWTVWGWKFAAGLVISSGASAAPSPRAVGKPPRASSRGEAGCCFMRINAPKPGNERRRRPHAERDNATTWPIRGCRSK